MREIALDTETTGLDPATGHRVVEIGCVEMRGRVRTGKHFHVYLNPERDMPPEAFRVHGLSSSFLADKPRFSAVAQDFLTFIADAPLIIHNALFDMRFLNAELAQVGLAPLAMERTVDTVLLARRKFPGAPAKLDALCKRFGIDLSARTLHGALLDAELLAEIYLELMGGRQERMALGQQISDGAQEQARAAPVAFPVRAFAPSAEELTAHTDFLKHLKAPLWQDA